MLALILAALAGFLVGGSLIYMMLDRHWQKQYDDLTVRAASYIDGLQRLCSSPDITVASTASRALRGTL